MRQVGGIKEETLTAFAHTMFASISAASKADSSDFPYPTPEVMYTVPNLLCQLCIHMDIHGQTKLSKWFVSIYEQEECGFKP